MTHQTTPPLAGEIERIRTRLEVCANSANRVSSDDLWAAERDGATLLAALDAADELNARLKLEAQCHAQEARTANATVHEIYQVISGATGEPGNWNGADPVKAYVAKAQERIAGLVEVVRMTQFGFNHARCSVCAGFGAGPDGLAQGEADGVHTATCPVGLALPSLGTKGEVG